MKKQSKILLGGLAVLIIVAVALFSTNSSLFQGRIFKRTTINRAEFAKLLVVNAGFETSNCDVFPDVPEDVWFNEYVCTLNDHGFMSGYPDGNFKPYESILRAEAAKIIYSAFEVDYACPLPALFTDVESNQWYYDSVNELAAYSFFSQETPIGTDFNPADALLLSDAKRWFSQSGNL